jgi:hypothetical protein
LESSSDKKEPIVSPDTPSNKAGSTLLECNNPTGITLKEVSRESFWATRRRLKIASGRREPLSTNKQIGKFMRFLVDEG